MDRESLVIDPLIFCQPGNENKPTKDVTLKRAQDETVFSFLTFKKTGPAVLLEGLQLQ